MVLAFCCLGGSYLGRFVVISVLFKSARRAAIYMISHKIAARRVASLNCKKRYDFYQDNCPPGSAKSKLILDYFFSYP